VHGRRGERANELCTLADMLDVIFDLVDA